MKKILCVILALILMSPPAMGSVRVGFLAKLNITQDEFQSIVLSERKKNGWQLMSLNHDKGESFYYYDSLVDMLMALSAGRIDEAVLPKIVGEYVLNSNSNMTIASVTQVKPMALVFGFNGTDNGSKIHADFNKALSDMKSDGTLDKLLDKYLSDPGMNTPEAIEFDEFKGKAIRVAVTGDLPPIDYVATDGKPAGFNTAVLAELGRRLRRNIELIDIDSGARTASLMSGRVDVVFWYEIVKDLDRQPDVPKGILLSEPYYDWNIFLYISKKQGKK